MRRLALILLFVVAASRAVAETITLPAFTPRLATDMRYRVQAETTVSLEGRGTRTARGDFHNTLNVGARTDAGWKLTWSVDAQEPPDGPYEGNELYRQTLAVYGVSSVAAEADGRGEPVRLDDGGQIKRNMEETIRRTLGAGPIPPGTVLDTVLKRIEADSTFPLRALAPAIALTTAMQVAAPTTFEIGQTASRTDVPRAFGEVIAPAVLTRTLASVDPAARIATFTWSEEADANVLARAMQPFLDRDIKDLRERLGRPSPQQAEPPPTVWARRNGTARVSLEDGVTLFAEETVSVRLGSMRNETVTRVTRE
jgi:hypothetical protein